jgi:hypothetical protein
MNNPQIIIRMPEKVAPSETSTKGVVQPAGLYNGSLKALSTELSDLCKMDDLGAATATPVLNENELKSVRALIAYVAYQLRMKESAVRENVTRRFHADDIAHLRSQAFDEVMRWLVDMCVEEILD